MTRNIKYIYACIPFIFFMACGYQTKALSPIYYPEGTEGSAEAVIINPKSNVGHEGVNVALDGIAIIVLYQGDYTVVRIPSGEHLLSLYEWPYFSKMVTFEAGKKYYFVVKHGWRREALLRIERDEAYGWSANNKYVPLDNSVSQKY